jgi:predicted transcriptional regulator
MGHWYPISCIIMSYDDVDWFPARMMLDYDDENLADIPHQEYLRRLEARIMMFIRGNQDDGIHHLDLAHKVGINRKNLTSHLRRLMMKGIVIRGNGKHGKYYPATKKYRGISVTADIFSKVAAGTILDYRDFPIDSPYIRSEIINENQTLETALFAFSNGVGAIITYLLIQSMNPSNDIPGRDANNDEEKDINVSGWFRDGMSTLGVFLLALFKQYMAGQLTVSSNSYVKKDGTCDFHRAGMDFLRFLYSEPSYTLDKKFITSLMASFSRTYPSISIQLDKIKSETPRVVSQEIDRQQYERISYWQQKKCKHDYRLPTNKSLSVKHGNNILHCCKCHKNKYIKNPFRKYRPVTIPME